MSMFKKITFFVIMLMISVAGIAQDKPVAMADTMRSEGRIYVVVAVMLTILAGLIIYVARIDRKISRLEKDN